ncbi:hypothetical protein BGZ94_004399 [Podila epigama]|nr:hypothetical protein BGZ94_004399 [Podila epigama]
MSPTTITIGAASPLPSSILKSATAAVTQDSSSAITYDIVEASSLASVFGEYCDLAVRSCGGKVLTASDEWFAEAENLITAAAPISRKGHFTAKGAWFDGWETRRHGPSFDW